MRFTYYNLENDEFNKKYGKFKKNKLFTIIFNSRVLEAIQFENSDRGYLLWINTPKRVNVFGFWTDDTYEGSTRFYQHWKNTGDYCG